MEDALSHNTFFCRALQVLVQIPTSLLGCAHSPGFSDMTIRVARGIHLQQVCISLVLESAPSGQLTRV